MLLLLLNVGCGDALVTADYRGVPLLSIEGRVFDVSYTRPGEVLKASVFWSRTGNPTVEVDKMVEHPAVATAVRFPATFEINLFDPPPMDRLTGSDDFQIGSIIVFADNDGDTHLSEGELRGGASVFAILYSERRVPAEVSPTGMVLEPGFKIVHLPLSCGLMLELGGQDCGVPIGDACAIDSDCGAGVCLHEDGFVEFNAGYCVLSVEAACRPAGAVEIPVVVPEAYDEEVWVWAKACTTDKECRTDGYECLQAFGACLPPEPLAIDMYPGYQPAPLCIPDGERGW